MLYGQLELFFINYSKNNLNYFEYNIFCFHKFVKKFLQIYKNGKYELQNRFRLLKKNHLNILNH